MSQKQLICTFLDLFKVEITFQTAKDVLKQLLCLGIRTLMPFFSQKNFSVCGLVWCVQSLSCFPSLLGPPAFRTEAYRSATSPAAVLNICSQKQTRKFKDSRYHVHFSYLGGRKPDWLRRCSLSAGAGPPLNAGSDKRWPFKSKPDSCEHEAPVEPVWLSKHGSNVLPAEFKEAGILRRTTLLFLLRSKSPLGPSGVNKGRCRK